MITTKRINEFDTWINIEANTFQNHPELISEYELEEDILEYALDKNERARIDYDRETQTFVIIYNVPNLVKREYHYETMPMTFIVQPNRLISISNEQNAYLVPHFERYLNANQGISVFNFLFSALFIISEYYFPLVEEINKERDQISLLLRKRTTRQNLLALSDLETGMVYFVAATKQNAVLLEQLRTQFVSRMLTEEEREELEDALIEARQLVEMTQLTSQILHQLSHTYNNVLNNNLNDTMRVLTVLSIILMVPSIITGYFGMNIPLPFADDPNGWFYLLVLNIGCCIGIAYLLEYMMSKK